MNIEWISVEERLPEEEGNYVVVVMGFTEIAEFVGYKPDKCTPIWNTSMAEDWSYPSHWMELPAPPGADDD